MKKINTFTILVLLALAVFAAPAFAQTNTLVQTSLSAAITPNQTSFAVASATGINAPSLTSGLAGSLLYVQDIGETAGEVMQVTGLSSTTVTVRRGQGGSRAVSHASGAMVLIATVPDWFATQDPVGACSTTAGSIAGDRWGPKVTPVLVIPSGRQWLCSSVTGTWVPGWGNTSAPVGATTAVASTAGKITPSGPLFHVTGTAAITGFNTPVGYNGGRFCIIPDGLFTTTAANEIAKATTAVVSQAICYAYDGKAAKPYFPSY